MDIEEKEPIPEDHAHHTNCPLITKPLSDKVMSEPVD